MTLTEIAIKRPTLIVVIFTVLSILGIASYRLLNYDLIPKMNIPTISISTIYTGASASEVESSVTKKIEEALSSMENIKTMKSTSQEGMSIIALEMESDADINLSLETAQRKLNAMLYQLPSDAKTPSINKFSTDDMPILKLSVTSGIPFLSSKLYEITNDQIKPQLSKIEGVGQVTLVGGNEREIQVSVSNAKLKAYNLTIGQLYDAIQQANMEMPTGNIESINSKYTVRLLGKVNSLDDIRNIVVSSSIDGKSVVKLSDIAQVTDGIAEQQNISLINGKSAIGILILKQTDANTVDVCKKVKEQLTILESQYKSQQIKFEIAADNSTYTLASANAVMQDLMFAVLLVALVMFIFLHSIRNSLIVLVSIPTSIISVFIAMYIFDFSLNMLTLMALSLVIGILVDDSIVVLENIYRHLQLGKNKYQASLDGRNEIGYTALAITLVDIVVFLPLSLVSGMIGNMLREFSLVIVFSTLMSLFVSFTITPLLASRFSKIQVLSSKTIIGRFSLSVENIYKQLVGLYEKALDWSLHNRMKVSVVILCLVLLSFALIPMGLIGNAFMNDGDRGEIVMKIEGEPYITLNESKAITAKIYTVLQTHPEVTNVFTNVGYTSSGMGDGSNAHYKSEITIALTDKKQRTIGVDEFAQIIKKEVLQIPGIKVTATPSNMIGNADDAPIQVLLRGVDMKKLIQMSDSIIELIHKIPGTKDVKRSVENSKPEIQINLDREKMELLGLSVQQVANTLSLALAGNTNLQYTEGDKNYDINLRFSDIDRNSINDLNSVSFINSKGNTIELNAFASIHQSLGPNKLERQDQIPSITINASVYGRPVGNVGDDIKETIQKNIRLNEITIDYKGQMENQAEAFGSLLTAILAALIFVYLVMVALYNSYLHPFVVMFSIPVALIGAFLALALSGESLTVFSMIGLIMLIGLVAKNAILIVDFTNKLREKGMAIHEALIESGKERLRPILMTTLSMVIGMLPIALASGAGAESKNGLAWVIIGGLTSSLVFTLVLIPIVYLTFENIKDWINKTFLIKPTISNTHDVSDTTI